MKPETTMEAAFAKAGKQSPRQKLIFIAKWCADSTPESFPDTIEAFWGAINTDAELMRTFFEPYYARHVGEFLKEHRPKKSSRGHQMVDTQNGDVSAGSSSGSDHCTADAHVVRVAPARQAGGRDQDIVDAQYVSVSPPARPRTLKGHIRATETIKRSQMDNYMITLRQGSRLPVGDMMIGQQSRSLGKQAVRRSMMSTEESIVITQITSWGENQAHLPARARVRDVMDLKTLESIISGARMMAEFRQRITVIDMKATPVLEAAHA